VPTSGTDLDATASTPSVQGTDDRRNVARLRTVSPTIQETVRFVRKREADRL